VGGGGATPPKDVIKREQYYLDLFKPEYNILKVAGSLLGFKHSEKTKAQIRAKALGRKISEETKAKMSVSKMGNSLPPARKKSTCRYKN
jgi:group I intron endonuclease